MCLSVSHIKNVNSVVFGGVERSIMGNKTTLHVGLLRVVGRASPPKIRESNHTFNMDIC